jgi:hypothetical protein
VSFVVTELASDADFEREGSPDVMRAFLRDAMDYSHLVATDAGALRDQLKRLSPDLQALWAETLRTAWVSSSGCACRRVEHRQVDPTLVSASSRSSACAVCGASVTRWPEFGSCPPVSALRTMRLSNISVGTHRDDIYRDRVGSLLVGVDEVAIFDRYAGSNVVSQGSASGLSWLIHRIRADKQVHVRLIVGTKSAYSRARIEVALRAHFTSVSAGVPGWLSLGTGADSRFAQHCHDRFIIVVRNGTEVALCLGKGANCFASPRATQVYGSQLSIGGTMLSGILPKLIGTGTEQVVL